MYTILIVDDDDSLRQMIRKVLENMGNKVVEASNGEAALKVFKTITPDMAILDVNMGHGMNGFQVCKSIRQDPFGVSIPIIFLTGMDNEDSLLHGFQQGADDYIRKPFNLIEFSARVNAQLSRLKRQTSRISLLGERQFKIGSEIKGEGEEKYIISSRLSSGGMGVIFRGYRVSDELQVVIKTLNSNFLGNYKDIQRFLREADSTIRLRHPNIAEGLEVVRTADHCFFVMKYVEGESLASMIEQEGYIEEKRAIKIVKQVARGLSHFNKFSLVHRDIKPGNILVTPDDTAILVDLGLTKSANTHADLTTEGVILGTPYYLSPEQALGDALDIRSDIYSLGATFYHAVTGSVPFHGSSTIAIINARFIGNPESVRDRRPNISSDVSKVISKMMSRNVAERYQTPDELIDILNNIVVN